jgi:hypothetical protein
MPSASADVAIPGPYDDLSHILCGMERPRAVRMNLHGKAAMVLFPVASILSAALLARVLPSPKDLLPVAVALVAALALVVWRFYARDKQLLSEGGVAMGRVTERVQGGRGFDIVTYAVEVPYSQIVSKTANSFGRNLSVGMWVPIFYDRINFKSQVALCASFYDVVPPAVVATGSPRIKPSLPSPLR